MLLALAHLIHCVPVLDPLGAETWQESPLWQADFGIQVSELVQMSVGFIRLSPYWQYVTVHLVGKSRMKGIFLR